MCVCVYVCEDKKKVRDQISDKYETKNKEKGVFCIKKMRKRMTTRLSWRLCSLHKRRSCVRISERVWGFLHVLAFVCLISHLHLTWILCRVESLLLPLFWILVPKRPWSFSLHPKQLKNQNKQRKIERSQNWIVFDWEHTELRGSSCWFFSLCPWWIVISSFSSESKNSVNW
jgi:hypothetical protein